MDNVPRFNFFSLTFLVGFGLGGFMGVLLGLLALALVQREDSQVGNAMVESSPTALVAGVTPTPEPKPRTKVALDVRLGPGTAFAVVGTIARGGEVEPVGRDSASGWVAIRFPPGSSARGWVPVTEVENLEDVERLAVVLPTPFPIGPRTPDSSPSGFEPGARVVTPIEPGRISITPTRASTTVAVNAATATPRPNLGPSDLVVNRASLLPDGRVQVIVGNRGPGDLVGRSVFVAVRDLTLRGEQLSSPIATLPVGGVVALQTQVFHIERETDVQIIVDPFGNVTDPDRSNNQLTVTLSPAPVPTPTRSPFE